MAVERRPSRWRQLTPEECSRNQHFPSRWLPGAGSSGRPFRRPSPRLPPWLVQNLCFKPKCRVVLSCNQTLTRGPGRAGAAPGAGRKQTLNGVHRSQRQGPERIIKPASSQAEATRLAVHSAGRGAEQSAGRPWTPAPRIPSLSFPGSLGIGPVWSSASSLLGLPGNGIHATGENK